MLSRASLNRWVVCVALVGGVQQPVPVQVLKISAGTKGQDMNGTFVLTDERTVFSRSTDREILVYFQWQDVPGPHKLTAQWRSPGGTASATSAIDYTADGPRFGAYWRLPITTDMALGSWSVDATMDGRPAGRFSFELTDIAVAAPLTRRPLTEAEAYGRLSQAFVVLRRAVSSGRELDPAAGFVPDPSTGHIYTSLSALDAADVIESVAADGQRAPVTHLLAASRPAQWALIRGKPLPAGEPLRPASAAPQVGARCYSIEGTTAGVRVLTVGTISGQMISATGQRTTIATFPSAFGMPGAPVVDEYGDLIGMVGTGVAGDSRPIEHIHAARGSISGAPVLTVPATAPVAADAQEIAALRAKGGLMPPVTGESQLATAGFTREPPKRGSLAATNLINEVSLREKAIFVVLSWAPTQRIRGEATLRVMDAEGRIVGTSPPRKINLNKGSYVQWLWDLPMVKQAGIYRFEVVVGTDTYWRAFLTVNP